MIPTKEQEEILDIIQDEDGDVRINAYAGTGKTSTLNMIVQDNPDKKFLYLAFNKAIAKEATKKFPNNCSVSTVHGLGFKESIKLVDDKKFFSKLNNFWKTNDYVKHFSMDTRLKPLIDKNQDFFLLANSVKSIVNEFKNSDYCTIEESLSIKFPSQVLKKEVLLIANELWEAEKDMDSKVPMDHNTYLKMWELSNPRIEGYDIVLFDEAQDANPVMLSVVEKMKGVRKVYVGDHFQSIYGWNGAVNAMAKMDPEHDCFLTKSWRFGDEIANEANRILKILDKDAPPLQGNKEIPSSKNTIESNEVVTMIFRTNGALAQSAVSSISQGKKVYVEGGVKELCEDLLALFKLMNGEKHFGKSKYRPYKYFGEVMQEAKVDHSIKRDLMFIKEYGSSTPTVLDLLKEKTLSKRSIKKAEVLLTTAHKSKGLEFENVILFDDFKLIDAVLKQEQGEGAMLSREEMNLLYVAITRAKKKINLSKSYELVIDTLTKRFT